MICDYDSKIVVTGPKGRKWRYHAPYHSGCSLYAWFGFSITKRFPRGSIMRAYWRDRHTDQRWGYIGKHRV